MNTRELIPFFKEITEKTSVVCKEYFRQPIDISIKSDYSPVTIVDQRVEQIIIENILETFPSHNIHSEESGKLEKKDSPYEWVIDPIDGTKTFITGVPLFATIIALLKDGIPIVGMYHNPILNDLIIGDQNTCWHNGVETQIRPCLSLSEAVLLTTDHFTVGKFQNQEGFDALVKECKMYRTWADAYGYFLLATGYADIMIDPIMSRWDSMAIIPIIKGAGGAITDYQGNSPVSGNSIVAAPENLLHEILNLLNPK